MLTDVELLNVIDTVSQNGVRPIPYRVFMHILSVGHDCHETTRQMGKACRMSHGSVNTYLHWLINNGYIEKDIFTGAYRIQPVELFGTKIDPTNRTVSKVDSFVYLMKIIDTPYYKIGIARDPGERIKAFRTQMPLDIDVIYTFFSSDARLAEVYLHLKFVSKRYRGEWFKLSDDDISFVKSIWGHGTEGFIFK